MAALPRGWVTSEQIAKANSISIEVLNYRRRVGHLPDDAWKHNPQDLRQVIYHRTKTNNALENLEPKPRETSKV